MKKDENEMKDELRPEYDLRSLRVRKVGPDRKRFGSHTIRLESDVAEIFPDSESVNEALRFLIRVAREKNRLFRVLADTEMKMYDNWSQFTRARYLQTDI